MLTFVQPDDDYGRWLTYRKAYKSWDTLRKRFTRHFGSMAYVQTLERHAKGGCHLNIIVANSAISMAVRNDWKGWRNTFLKPHATQSGFGPICWVELFDNNAEAMAGYMTKLANELTGSGPKNQVPIDAPPHFRRIRASRGLLPKKPPPDMVGELVRLPIPEYNHVQPGQSACGSVGMPAAVPSTQHKPGRSILTADGTTADTDQVVVK